MCLEFHNPELIEWKPGHDQGHVALKRLSGKHFHDGDMTEHYPLGGNK